MVLLIIVLISLVSTLSLSYLAIRTVYTTHKKSVDAIRYMDNDLMGLIAILLLMMFTTFLITLAAINNTFLHYV